MKVGDMSISVNPENLIRGVQVQLKKRDNLQVTFHRSVGPPPTGWDRAAWKRFATPYRIEMPVSWWASHWRFVDLAITHMLAHGTHERNCSAASVKVTIGDDIVLTFYYEVPRQVTNVVRVPISWWRQHHVNLGQQVDETVDTATASGHSEWRGRGYI